MSAKTSHRRAAARTVKFTAAALADLTPGVEFMPGAAEQLRTQRFTTIAGELTAGTEVAE